MGPYLYDQLGSPVVTSVGFVKLPGEEKKKDEIFSVIPRDLEMRVMDLRSVKRDDRLKLDPFAAQYESWPKGEVAVVVLQVEGAEEFELEHYRDAFEPYVDVVRHECNGLGGFEAYHKRDRFVVVFEKCTFAARFCFQVGLRASR